MQLNGVNGRCSHGMVACRRITRLRLYLRAYHQFRNQRRYYFGQIHGVTDVQDWLFALPSSRLVQAFRQVDQDWVQLHFSCLTFILRNLLFSLHHLAH